MMLNPADATTFDGDQTAAERQRHVFCRLHQAAHGCHGHSQAYKQTCDFCLLTCQIVMQSL